MTHPARHRLALTLGDARGIGPEIVAKALNDPRVQALEVAWRVIGPDGTEQPVDDAVGMWEPTGDVEVDTAHAGRMAGDAVRLAADLALGGVVQGMVTAPLDKSALLAGGHDYPGHTELLAARAGVPATMMLASDALRVVLATTHIALREVTSHLTASAIAEAARATRGGLVRDFGIAEPRIALCALNPHAGDHGRFGREDDELLRPAARANGLLGPYPADTVFVRALRGEFDAVIAPYHDVGMTAIKVASFGEAVNLTLGLPFVRTSPDHGTALDIAGRGVASAESLVRAMRMAVEIVRRRELLTAGTATASG